MQYSLLPILHYILHSCYQQVPRKSRHWGAFCCDR